MESGISFVDEFAWAEKGECRQLARAGLYTPQEMATIFHPGQGEDFALAKAICRNCPVQSECLSYAITHNERLGIWGGASGVERRRFYRKQYLQELRDAGIYVPGSPPGEVRRKSEAS